MCWASKINKLCRQRPEANTVLRISLFLFLFIEGTWDTIIKYSFSFAFSTCMTLRSLTAGNHIISLYRSVVLFSFTNISHRVWLLCAVRTHIKWLNLYRTSNRNGQNTKMTLLDYGCCGPSNENKYGIHRNYYNYVFFLGVWVNSRARAVQMRVSEREREKRERRQEYEIIRDIMHQQQSRLGRVLCIIG